MAEASTQQPLGKQETTMAVAKEKATAMGMENATPPPSRDLVMTALVLAAEALATLKAATAATMVLTAEAAALTLVLAAEAAAALKAVNANGGDGGKTIVGDASFTVEGGVIN